jgi:predicted permease
MDSLLQDLRFAWRSLVHRPGFTLTVVLTLALGIGANTALFSVVNGVLLKPLPLPASERLVAVWSTSSTLPEEPASLPDFRDWREGARGVVTLAAVDPATLDLTPEGADPVQLQGMEASADLLEVLGVQPALGRGFFPEEERGGANGVVLLSHETWQRHFGGDPGVLGRPVTLSGRAHTVVGVLPAGLRIPFSDWGEQRVDAWVPMAADAADAGRRSDYLRVVGRLVPGASLEQAQAVLAGVASRLAREYPDTNTGMEVRVLSLHEELVGNSRQGLLLFMGAVGLLLLIACANVANLMLARSLMRARELAVRSALGAGRGRLARQVLTESVLLAVLGGASGVLVAVWALDGLKGAQGLALPRLQELALDGRALLFALGVTLLAGVLAGLAPAVGLKERDLQGALKAGGGGGAGGAGLKRVRGGLVLVEVALALVLLVGAGLLARSLLAVQRVDLGFKAEGVLSASVNLPAARYPDAAARGAFSRRLLERLQAVPGVEAAAVSTSVPLGGGNNYLSFGIQGRPPAEPGELRDAIVSSATETLFATLGIPLLQGRLPTASEQAAPVLVINRTFAERYWPGQDPVGARVTFDDASYLEVVGVVGDVKQKGPDAKPYPQAWRPLALGGPAGQVALVRSAREAAGLAADVRQALREVDPLLPITSLRTMEARLERALATRRLSLSLIAAFAAVALVLASVGLAGVVSHAVTQRTREVGIRMALGARAEDVLRLVVGQGMRPALWGILAGLAAALLGSRLLSGLLYGVGAVDPLTFLLVPLLLALVALLATWLPARRATRVEPTEALRAD